MRDGAEHLEQAESRDEQPGNRDTRVDNPRGADRTLHVVDEPLERIDVTAALLARVVVVVNPGELSRSHPHVCFQLGTDVDERSALFDPPEFVEEQSEGHEHPEDADGHEIRSLDAARVARLWKQEINSGA